MTLRDQRDSIMRALEIAVDQCIQGAEDHGDPVPETFTADLTVTFGGTALYVRSAPKLDFRKPLEPQLETEAQEVTERTVILNGTPTPVEAPFLTYEDIVFMVCGDKKRILSVVCAVRGLESQVLTPGKSVRVREGMRINAMSTNNA